MPLLDNQKQTREIHVKTTLLLLAVALSAVEYVIPRIPLFPWLKPGLANIVTLVWIIRYGFLDSIVFALVRIWIVSFYFGFSFISFVLGLSGALAACLAMYGCWYAAGRFRLMGTVGIAVIGAVFHNAGQLTAVYFLMAQNAHLLYQLPLMIAASIGFGAVVGVVVPVILSATDNHLRFDDVKEIVLASPKHNPTRSLSVSLFFLALCVGLVFITDAAILSIVALLVTIYASYCNKRFIMTALFPVRRFWALFVFIAMIHLFFSYGTRFNTVPFITHEGLQNTIVQWLRLWAWIQTTFIFTYFGFNAILLKMFKRFFPSREDTLVAGLLCAEYFPDIVDLVRGRAWKFLGMIFKTPSKAVGELMQDVAVVVVKKNLAVESKQPDRN